MRHDKLLHGDCLSLLPTIPDSSIDMILVDPPYGKVRCKWDIIIPFEPMWEQVWRVLKPNGACVMFGAEPFSSALRMSCIKYFKYDWIWDKIKGTGFLNAKKQPMRNHEIISVFYRKQCTYNPQMTHGHVRKQSYCAKHLQTEVYQQMRNDYYYDSTERYPRSILEFSTDTQNSSLHPTQKPVALCEYLIRTYTNEGETVLDFCMGSGTTGVAAINTDRNFIGIELEQKYYDIARKRIEESEKEVVTHEN